MEVRTGYKQTEIGVIPEDWDVKKLGEIASFSQGVQVDLNKQIREYADDYIKFLRIENYTQLSDDFRYIPIEYQKSNFIKIEDIVVVRYGATAGFIGRGFSGVLANNLFKVEPNINLLDKGYLFLYLKSDNTFKFFQNSMFGGAMPALSFKIVKALPFPLPPTKSEQTAIATTLSDTDTLISSLEKLIAKKRNIKQGAMQKLLQPKDGWEVKKLGEIAEIIGGGTPSTSIPNYWNGSINWFTPTEIGKSKYTSESVRKITTEGLSNSSGKILPIGTVLLTSRAGIGDVSILMYEGCTNQGFQSLVAKDGYSNEYIY